MVSGDGSNHISVISHIRRNRGVRVERRPSVRSRTAQVAHTCQFLVSATLFFFLPPEPEYEETN